jgi:response regulator RpfG family c-di-GMP phosphodiesterase
MGPQRGAFQQLVESQLVGENYVRKLFVSAPLHDIGKVGIPDHILGIALYHQEKWDGSGYPEGFRPGYF